MSLSYSADIVLYFRGQPSKQQYIGHARDREHAITLAKMNAQAAGWDLNKLDEVLVLGESK